MTFSDIEKSNIKETLISSCEESWSRYGYKKTSIDELCAKAGISKGSFYLFYHSKEELFCDVMLKAQEKLIQLTKENLGPNPTKQDLATALKLVFREFSKLTFITETHTPDFIAFMNKLPKEKREEMEAHGNYDLRDVIRKTKLTYRIEEDKGLAALGVLFTPRAEKECLFWNYLNVFDFMADTLIEEIFE